MKPKFDYGRGFHRTRAVKLCKPHKMLHIYIKKKKKSQGDSSLHKVKHLVQSHRNKAILPMKTKVQKQYSWIPTPQVQKKNICKHTLISSCVYTSRLKTLMLF